MRVWYPLPSHSIVSWYSACSGLAMIPSNLVNPYGPPQSSGGQFSFTFHTDGVAISGNGFRIYLRLSVCAPSVSEIIFIREFCRLFAVTTKSSFCSPGIDTIEFIEIVFRVWCRIFIFIDHKTVKMGISPAHHFLENEV